MVAEVVLPLFGIKQRATLYTSLQRVGVEAPPIKAAERPVQTREHPLRASERVAELEEWVETAAQAEEGLLASPPTLEPVEAGRDGRPMGLRAPSLPRVEGVRLR